MRWRAKSLNIILEKVQLQQARESGIKVDDYAVSQAENRVWPARTT